MWAGIALAGAVQLATPWVGARATTAMAPGREHWYVGLEDGRLHVRREGGGAQPAMVGPMYLWWVPSPWWWRMGLVPEVGWGPSKFVVLPMWVPLVGLGAAAWRLRRARDPAPGRCAGCGYDLAGSRGAVCPERGRADAPAARA